MDKKMSIRRGFRTTLCVVLTILLCRSIGYDILKIDLGLGIMVALFSGIISAALDYFLTSREKPDGELIIDDRDEDRTKWIFDIDPSVVKTKKNIRITIKPCS